MSDNRQDLYGDMLGSDLSEETHSETPSGLFREVRRLSNIAVTHQQELSRLVSKDKEVNQSLDRIIQLLEGAFGEGGIVARISLAEKAIALNSVKLAVGLGLCLACSVLLPVLVSLIIMKV